MRRPARTQCDECRGIIVEAVAVTVTRPEQPEPLEFCSVPCWDQWMADRLRAKYPGWAPSRRLDVSVTA